MKRSVFIVKQWETKSGNEGGSHHGHKSIKLKLVDHSTWIHFYWVSLWPLFVCSFLAPQSIKKSYYLMICIFNVWNSNTFLIYVVMRNKNVFHEKTVYNRIFYYFSKNQQKKIIKISFTIILSHHRPVYKWRTNFCCKIL